MFQYLSYLRAFALAWAVVLCSLAGVLLFTAVTTQGVMFAIGALLLGVTPGLAWMNPENYRWRRGALVALIAWLGIAVWLYYAAPDGRPSSGARVENRYVGGEWQYHRHSLGALLPEVDQLLLGFRLTPTVDSLMTFDQARPLLKDTRAIYAELEADPDFHALGSQMPDAYNDLLSSPFDHGHYYLYVPHKLDRKSPAPALVFLHGSGGNFKAYTWLLSRVAEERGMVLIAPSFGFGNWDLRHHAGMISKVLDDVQNVVQIDKSRVHLAGLSNGGLGVTRVAKSEQAERLRSLILISPVCDEVAIASTNFATQWHDKPVLIITGETDDRVPLSYVQKNADTMRNAGAVVEMSVYPGVNHFLIFSQKERCLKEISDWVEKQK